MKVVKTAFISLLLLSCCVQKIQGYSACDDIDVVFLMDSNSLIHNSFAILEFVYSIVHHGSSENAGFSIYLYGDDIKKAQEIQLLDTFDTHRLNKSNILLQHIKQEFLTAIEPLHLSSEPVSSVSLKDVFIAATQQEQPQRINARNHKIKYSKHGVGASDGHNRYFIFDHFNELINKDNDEDICELLDYLDNTGDDESIHFIQGQQFIKLENMFNGLCNNKYKHLLNDDLFWYLNKTHDVNSDYNGPEFRDDSESSEEDYYNFGHFRDYNDDYNVGYDHDQHLYAYDQIFHLTCPAFIKYSESLQDDQHIHLTAHNQYIEPDTIIKCHEQFEDDGHSGTMLDSDTSYILVHDYLNDGNTFKVNDFLIADKDIYQEIQIKGCQQYMYQIKDIHLLQIVDSDHKILKLSVGPVISIHDFILYIDLDSSAPIHHTNTQQGTDFATKGNYSNGNNYETGNHETGNHETGTSLSNGRRLLWNGKGYKKLQEAESGTWTSFNNGLKRDGAGGTTDQDLLSDTDVLDDTKADEQLEKIENKETEDKYKQKDLIDGKWEILKNTLEFGGKKSI